MDCQNLQFLGDINALQLYLLSENRKVLSELSEGHWSLVIIVNILKLYCYWYRNKPCECFYKKVLHSLVDFMDDMKKIKTKIKTFTV